MLRCHRQTCEYTSSLCMYLQRYSSDWKIQNETNDWDEILFMYYINTLIIHYIKVINKHYIKIINKLYIKVINYLRWIKNNFLRNPIITKYSYAWSILLYVVCKTGTIFLFLIFLDHLKEKHKKYLILSVNNKTSLSYKSLSDSRRDFISGWRT